MLKSQLKREGGLFTVSDNVVVISEGKIILLYCPFCGKDLARDKILVHSGMPTDAQLAVLQQKIEQARSDDELETVFGKPTRILMSPKGSGAKRMYFDEAVAGLRVIVHVDEKGGLRFMWSAISERGSD